MEELAERPLVVGVEQTKTKAGKDIEALYLRVEMLDFNVEQVVFSLLA